METKKWFMSKGIWGSLLVTVVVILRLLGRESEAGVVEAESAPIAEWALRAATVAGAALAFIGRLTAKKKITL